MRCLILYGTKRPNPSLHDYVKVRTGYYVRTEIVEADSLVHAMDKVKLEASETFLNSVPAP